jgi:RNA polymerase sigma-70 factor (ECF subfamily)
MEKGQSPAASFADFFRGSYPGLVRAAYLLTADQGEAEELAQETMARAFERWDRVRLMESPNGYLYRTAVNLNRKRLRHLATRARRLMAIRQHDEAFTTTEAHAELSEALSVLPRQLREAVMLVEWLGLNTEEAGRTLGIKSSSVRSRIHRARRLLTERLMGKEDFDE